MKTRNGKVFGIEDNDTPRPAAQTESSVAVAALKKKRVNFHCFDITEVHMTHCTPTELGDMQHEYYTTAPTGRPGRKWDFSHIDAFIATTLQDNPHHNLFLYGYATSYLTNAGHQAPIYAAFLMPAELGPPTNSMCLRNNEEGVDECHSFDHFGYSWKPSNDPNHKGRVHLLACDKDFEKMSKDDSELHGRGVMFMAKPDDLQTNHRSGKINVDCVRIKFVCPLWELGEDEDGVLDGTWFPAEMEFDNFIKQFVKCHYSKDELMEKGFDTNQKIRAKISEIKDCLSTTVEAALEQARKEKQEKLDSFFSSIDYVAEQLDNIKMFSLFPINFPAPIKLKLPGEYMDEFWQQLGDNRRHVISDHYSSVSSSGLRQQLRQLGGDEVLNVFDVADTFSSTRRLHMLLLIDFVFGTSGFGRSSNSDFTITPFIHYLDEIVSIFGMKRIIHFMGDENVENKFQMNKGRYLHYINGLVEGVKDAIRSIDRQPSSVMDFLTTFLFEESRGRRRRDNLFGADSIRLEESSNALQLQFQVEDRWINTDIRGLNNIISDDGRLELLLRLLLNPLGHALVIPSGARDGDVSADDAVTQHISFDCVKASLLLTSDGVLSPPGKKRVKEALPDHEIPMCQLLSKIDASVKTIRVGEVKANSHDMAMTGTDEMLAIFQDDGEHKHCLYINGVEGTISDPVEGFGVGLPRTNESLRELGVSEFRQVFTVRRIKDELSEKKRKLLQAKTGLPYF
ncbi:hypothetical protein QTG54_015758 [Skeletonema marinoi]|uniref:Uncharacterized protein n=1 Tax=Skeletonema marinoi TaxID=267567 RepID=A0AAD8XUF2_9STRA|nr:hypothetical protein QTG54_015758 [Skeletonema marinoi]